MNKYTGVIKSAPKECVGIHNLSREGILDYLLTMHVLTIYLYNKSA